LEEGLFLLWHRKIKSEIAILCRQLNPFFLFTIQTSDVEEKGPKKKIFVPSVPSH
jgi:hypothetical protein